MSLVTNVFKSDRPTCQTELSLVDHTYRREGMFYTVSCYVDECMRLGNVQT